MLALLLTEDGIGLTFISLTFSAGVTVEGGGCAGLTGYWQVNVSREDVWYDPKNGEPHFQNEDT